MSIQDEGEAELEANLADEITRTALADLGTGSALWESVAGNWVLLKCGCTAGFQAGLPPEEPGRYEGEIIRKFCEPIAS
jgi:hypothetical protein